MKSEFTRQEKFLFVVPLLCLPFLFLGFIALGGGTRAKQVDPAKKDVGFNTDLPKPKLRDESEWNKLSFYESAEKDSDKLKEQMLADPYYRFSTIKTDSNGVFDGKISYDPSPATITEDKINERIRHINTLIQSDTENEMTAKKKPVVTKDMLTYPDLPNEVDPELKQLDGMLDKIMAIQNPNSANERMRKESEKNRQFVFPIETNSKHTKVTLLEDVKPANDTGKKKTVFVQRNSFAGLPEIQPITNVSTAAVSAIVEETQTVVSGNTLSLRLTNDVVVAGMLIPSNSKLSGVVNLEADRLSVRITSIRFQNYLLPVELSAYDLDGLQGINIPNAITRDVSKQSASQAIQGLSMSSLDPSIGAQAASAGIEAAKQLLSRKVKLIQVTVPAGYRVFLRSKDF